MMPHPCEPNPQYYRQPHEETRGHTMPAPCGPTPYVYPPRPEDPRGPLATYPTEAQESCRRDWQRPPPETQVRPQEEVGPKRSVEDLPTCPPSIQVPSAPAPGSPELPSIGSEGHASGECRPCAFLYAKGCQNGAMCLFCHLCDKGEKKRRQKAKKASFQGGA